MEDKSSRLIIGCANFGHEYNGTYVPPDEQEKIWDYCREVGIDTVDTAVAYGKIDIPNDFKVIMKVRPYDNSLPRYDVLLAHYAMDYHLLLSHRYRTKGVSLYYPAELATVMPLKPQIFQMPYKPFKMWLPELKRRGIETHVRKVFADDCYEEAIADPNVDGIVIGIDNVEQLKQNVRLLVEKEQK